MDAKRSSSRHVVAVAGQPLNIDPRSGTVPCEACDAFDVEIAIHGPRHLRQVVAKIRTAVGARQLVPHDGRDSGDQDSRPSFADLDLDASIPDVLDYSFRCPACGAGYRLTVESYHGSGGTWSRQPERDPDSELGHGTRQGQE